MFLFFSLHNQWPTTGISKAVVCPVLCVGTQIEESLLLLEKYSMFPLRLWVENNWPTVLINKSVFCSGVVKNKHKQNKNKQTKIKQSTPNWSPPPQTNPPPPTKQKNNNKKSPHKIKSLFSYYYCSECALDRMLEPYLDTDLNKSVMFKCKWRWFLNLTLNLEQPYDRESIAA